MQNLFNSSQWLTSPSAYWTIQYEYKRNGVDMQYRFYWKVWVASGHWYNDGLKLKLFLNGVQNDVTVKAYQSGVTGWSYDGTTGWYTVANKTSGTVPFYAQLMDTNTNLTRATSASYSLSVSPYGAVLTSAPNFTDEDNPTIHYTNPLGNNVESLQACISLTGDVADILYRDISKTGTSYTFNLTEEERKVLRKATANGDFREVLFVTRTIINGTIYYSNIPVILSIIHAAPIFTESNITYKDTNAKSVAVTGNNQQIVQDQSNLVVTIANVVAQKEAKIVQYDITVNGITKTLTENGTADFGIQKTSSNIEISATVMDSRGFMATAKKTVTVLSWSKPLWVVFLERKNNYEDETYLKVDAGYSSIDGKNTVTASYKYKEIGGEYGEPVPIENKTQYTLTCDKNKAYIFSVTIADAFDSVTNEVELSKGKFPLFIDTEKSAVGINEFPANDEALRVAGGTAHFEDGVKISGNVLADYIIETGTSGVWTYEKWASGKAVCWCTTDAMEVKYTEPHYSYFYYAMVSCNLPSNLFFSPPSYASVNTLSNSGLLFNSIGSLTKDGVLWHAVSAVTSPITLNVRFAIEIKGRWKS